jgi:hypothetical protein
MRLHRNSCRGRLRAGNMTIRAAGINCRTALIPTAPRRKFRHRAPFPAAGGLKVAHTGPEFNPEPEE